jgi:uncharacterized protein YqjF (DUF2071 family)
MLTEQELLLQTSHRPYNLPDTPYIGYQQWQDVVFLHCKVPAALLLPSLPAGLELDTYEGEAWVSLVAFCIPVLSPRYFFYRPSLHNLKEINIRTYVKNQQHPGIFMLHMAADHHLFVWLSRLFFALPYEKAVIGTAKGIYQCAHKAFHFDISYTSGIPIDHKKPLDEWLTERYALFTFSGKKLYRIDIHHMPWKLKTIHLPFAYFSFNHAQFSISEKNIALAHYGSTQQVLNWPRVPVS